MSTSAREREREKEDGGERNTKRKGREEIEHGRKKEQWGGGLNLGRMGYFI
jgi:hypothetical protein